MIEEKLTEEEIMGYGLCFYKPEINCNKDYECKKLDRAYRKRRPYWGKSKNPFANSKGEPSTSDPGFVCPNQISDELKKIAGIKW